MAARCAHSSGVRSNLLRRVGRVGLWLLALSGLLGGLEARPAAAATTTTTISVMWNWNTETDVVGYRVSWGTTSGAYTHIVDVGNQNTLQFTEPDATIPYYFAIQAYNAGGLTSPYSAEVVSTPVIPPTSPVVVTGAVSAVTATGATLTGTANPGGATALGYFEYGLTTAYGTQTLAMNLAAGTQAVAIGNGTVTGLTCNTTYHVHAVASNSVGTTAGKDATFKTAACVAAPKAVTAAASAITATRATLNGRVRPSGRATTAAFQYGPTTSYGSTTTTMSAGSGTTSTAITNGSVTGLTCATVYHFRATATNPGGTATGADASFTTAACPTATASPSGTRVPTAASLTDSALAVWTLSAGQALRNGAGTGGYGSQILWFQSTIYVLGGDSNWWKYTGSTWTLVGPTDPSAAPTTSASGTRVPAVASLTDSALAVWTLSAGQALRNGQATGGYGSQILWYQSTIYVLGGDSTWWKYTGTSWTSVGATDPSAAPTVSASGTQVPAAASITDSALAVWTLSAGQVLRNGQATGGYGSKILWSKSVIYVLGGDNNWWVWTGSTWTLYGAATPV
jgi:hypothetical protein